MTAIALPKPAAKARAAVAAAAAGVVAVAVVATVTFPSQSTVAAAPTHDAIAFAVALRTFETTGVALADQAAVESASPRIRQAAAALRVDGDAVAGGLWALMDRWGVPGTERLPAPASTTLTTAGPAAGLRHACTLVGNDELARLSLLGGVAFDQQFTSAWIGHTQAALQALAEAKVAVPMAPGLAALTGEARHLLERDTSTLAAAGR